MIGYIYTCIFVCVYIYDRGGDGKKNKVHVRAYLCVTVAILPDKKYVHVYVYVSIYRHIYV